MSAVPAPTLGVNDGQQLEQLVRNIGQGSASGLDRISDSVATLSERVQQNGAARVLNEERDVVGTFVESSQAVMCALDAVQQVHPFIAAVVLAFKAAMELELTRRENDAKVVLIKSRMLDAVEVLIDLKDVNDASKSNADGTTLEDRLRRILRAMEKDIRDCSALCEKYVQKRFIVKLFDGARWQARLAEYDAIFSEHREQLSLALSTCVARAVDDLREAVHDLKAATEANDDRTSMLLLFKQLERPNERDLLRFITEHGGASACLEDEAVFGELQGLVRVGDPHHGGRLGAEDSRMDMAAIRMEMRSDLGHALAEDRQDFDAKFDAVKTQLEEMRSTVSRSGERIVQAIHAGPHDGLIDPDMYNIWKEMAWKRRVKGRHFVAALQDYFQDKCWGSDCDVNSGALVVHRGRRVAPAAFLALTSRDSSRFSRARDAIPVRRLDNSQDCWALPYVTSSRMRTILEGLNCNITGWVTVRDVNSFTASRPHGYSVLKWIAFWSIGFPVLSARYARNSESQRARMVRLAEHSLPCNRARVDRYLSSSSWSVLDHFVRGSAINSDLECDVAVMSHFDDWMCSEYARLQHNLDLYQWHIDMSNTLSLVMDNRPLEHLILPLLALLLQRHTDIIQLATKYHLNDLELYDAQRCIETVAQGVQHRFATLKSSYEHQDFDKQSHLRQAFNGMFSVLYDWDTNPAGGTAEQAISVEENAPEPDPGLLSYGTSSSALPEQFYHAPSPLDHSVEGLWAGFYLSDDGSRQGWLALRLLLTADNMITGSGQDTVGRFTLTGTLTQHSTAANSAAQRIVLRKAYVFSGRRPVWRYTGELCTGHEGKVIGIRGVWGAWSDGGEETVVVGSFRLSRGDAPFTDEESRSAYTGRGLSSAKDMWQRALHLVRDDVRRRSWSWSFFRQRLHDRRAAVEAHMMMLVAKDPQRYPRVWPRDHGHTMPVRTRWTYEDEAFHRFLAERRLNWESVHSSSTCACCGATPTGAKYSCLDCGDLGTSHEICSPCFTISILRTASDVESAAAGTHLVDHVIVKVSRVLHAPTVKRINAVVLARAQQLKEIMRLRHGQQHPGTLSELHARVPAPACHLCMQEIAQTCWLCAECDEDIVICGACQSSSDHAPDVIGHAGHTSVSSRERSTLHHHSDHILIWVSTRQARRPGDGVDAPEQDQLAVLIDSLDSHRLAVEAKLSIVEVSLEKLHHRVSLAMQLGFAWLLILTLYLGCTLPG